MSRCSASLLCAAALQLLASATWAQAVGVLAEKPANVSDQDVLELALLPPLPKEDDTPTVLSPRLIATTFTQVQERMGLPSGLSPHALQFGADIEIRPVLEPLVKMQGLPAFTVTLAMMGGWGGQKLLLTGALKDAEKRDTDRDEAVYHVVGSLSFVLLNEGNWAEALPLLQKRLALAKKLYPKEHGLHYYTLQWLALCYSKLDRPNDAYEAQSQRLSIARTHLSASAYMVGDAYTELAAVALSLKDHNSAESSARTALGVIERAFDDTEPRGASAMAILADALEAQVLVKGADRSILIQVERLRRRVLELEGRFGVGSAGLAIRKHQLAMTLTNVKKMGEAAELERQALADMEKVKGPSSEDTLTLRKILGQITSVLGKEDIAESDARQNLTETTNRYSNDDLRVADCQHALGNLMVERSRLDEAETCYKEALRIRTKAHGERHKDVARTLNNLGVVHESRKDLVEAEKCFRSAWDIDKRVYGVDSAEAWQTLSSICGLLYKSGRGAMADDLVQQRIREAEQRLGRSNPELAVTLRRAAGVKISQKMFTECQGLMRRALSIIDQARGENHPDSASLLQSLSYMELTRGDCVNAEMYARKMVMLFVNAGRKAGKPHDGLTKALEDYKHILELMRLPLHLSYQRLEKLRAGEDPGLLKYDFRQ
jgi:tetratricopeptide (TPR) repeat protein